MRSSRRGTWRSCRGWRRASSGCAAMVASGIAMGLSHPMWPHAVCNSHRYIGLLKLCNDRSDVRGVPAVFVVEMWASDARQKG
eukprot:7208864-Pyramimonas_sp.AAC.1